MAAANFTLAPSTVIPLPPVFNTIVTQAETMEKQYQNISGNAVLKYKLIFKVLTNANFLVLFNHYHSAKGEYDSFSWTSVPSYIDTDQDGSGDGTNLTGHWVTGSLTYHPLSSTHWSAEVIFEKSV